MDRKIKMPLVQRLHEYVQAKPVRLHVPGHKGYLTKPTEPAVTYFQSLLPIDVTELAGLDDLHAPESVIAKAQSLAAQCFAAEHTYFLINGTTVGNLAMVLGTLEPGDYVFVQRNSHKSIFNALALVKARAVFLEPELCPTFGVPIGLTVEEVRKGLEQYPQAKAIILTYPNYYGMAMPLRDIITLAHQHNLVVLVDEAHGAHFGQYPSLPPSAMHLGADVSVQSTHKMLGSLTQTSMLHIQGSRVDREEIEYYLRCLQSSSPSYPLMASLDLARAMLESMDRTIWERSLAAYTYLREEIGRLAAYTISGAGPVEGSPWGVSQDPFKLIIQSKGDVSGYQLQEELAALGIYTELADPLNVLCTLPLVHNQEWNTLLLQALSKLVTKSKVKSAEQKLEKRKYPPQQQLSCVPMEIIKQKDMELLPLEQAIGRQAAEMIIPYPPGIPVLFPGEIISQEIVTYIQQLHQLGATIQGKGKVPISQILVKKKYGKKTSNKQVNGR